MSGKKAFLDTNVLLYLLSSNAAKADKAESLLRQGPVISIQVLNETVNVLLRKMQMPWPDIAEFTDVIRSLCAVESMTISTFEHGIAISRKYMLSFYDSTIVGAALLSGCGILYSEDMQDGLRIDNKVLLRNPFKDT